MTPRQIDILMNTLRKIQIHAALGSDKRLMNLTSKAMLIIKKEHRKMKKLL